MKCQLTIGNLEVVLDLAGVEGLALRINAWGGEHVGSLVHIGEQKGGANTRFGVKPRAAVTMPASSDLEVKRAVNSVFLCSEYRRQVFRHYCLLVNGEETDDYDGRDHYSPPFSISVFVEI